MMVAGATTSYSVRYLVIDLNSLTLPVLVIEEIQYRGDSPWEQEMQPSQRI